MTENKRNLPDSNLQEPETGSLEGSEVVTVERTWTTEDMLKMSEKGMSNPQIGAVVHLTAEGVRQRLKKYKGQQTALETFKEAEVDILAGKRKLILDSLSDADIRATKSIRDRAVTYGILTDKARLLSGDSTSNIGINFRWVDIVSAIHRPAEGNSWQQERKALADRGLDADHEDKAYLARCRQRATEEGPAALAEFDAYQKDQVARWKAAGK